MRKSGTGAVQAVWSWWQNVKTRSVEKYSRPAAIILLLALLVITTGYSNCRSSNNAGNNPGNANTAAGTSITIPPDADDDWARDLINRLDCSQLNGGLTDDQMVRLINEMLDGSPGDDDEDAILKLLNCLNQSRLRTVVGVVGRQALERSFDGDQLDELEATLALQIDLTFSDLDDDASVIVVNRLTCEQIGAADFFNNRDLIQNLLDGSVGDDEEGAILKIFRCMNCDDVRVMLRQTGMSRSDLESAFDGAEEVALTNRLRQCP